MDSKIIDINSSQKEIEVNLSYDEIKNELESELRKQVQKIQMPGFRKGKVPPGMIKKMYGDSLEYEASEKVANSMFWKISEEQNIKPVGRPALKDIKYTPGSSLFFKVHYEVIPQLDVDGYKDNTIEIPGFHIHDEDVERDIQQIRNSGRILEPAEVTGEDNNYVINAEIIRTDENGSPLEGVKAENLKIDLTNERVLPEILTNSRNKKTGDTFTFSFEDERLVKNEQGEESNVKEKFNYKAEIKGIEKVILPELNEEYIKKVTKDKVSNETELRDAIRADISNYYKDQAEKITFNKLIQVIVEKNDFVPPAALVANVLEDMIKHEEEHAKKEGWKLDRNEAENRLRPSAENNVKWFLLKDAIKQKENISVPEEELSALAEKDQERTGIALDKLLNYYKSSNYKEKLEDSKLLEFLKSNNKIIEKEHDHSH